MTSLTLTLDPVVRLTREQFYELCKVNHDICLERSSTGDLILMPPTGWESGQRNADLTTNLNLWNRQARLGIVFDSSTGFSLPNGADRSPDVAWVEKSRIEALAPDPARFLPLAPDFVIELRSATDKLATLQHKMAEYRDCGVRLGWLIDPQEKRVEIYRLGRPTEYLSQPEQLSGEEVLSGFVLVMAEIWG
ncbi:MULTISPECIES: Uma2 family endonuclease [Cyanophyceae]|uniref:Uma2 family endonuclease n=1 Tax=Cyanophyceae TaxID=3028117 RepID=UPI0016864A99|nr:MULTISPECIES: Uma2 family endonuclease [Cyanophyceae]MBD1915560.1 Uma2 family endonuclease [Phormidium sp. FACHB-77]MBD2031870.1 Uma2 family endonuclease [Phormidium sp. FACHB-322]MBD2050620.1 Uma2 family endonuclease [Leptolyngbya sp. FACHB-60]